MFVELDGEGYLLSFLGVIVNDRGNVDLVSFSMTYMGVRVRTSKAISRFGLGRIIRIGRTGEAADDPMATGALLLIPAEGMPSQ